MKAWLVSRYFEAVLDHSVVTLLIGGMFVTMLAVFVPRFTLDTSAMSLVLADRDVVTYYRSIRTSYGSDDFLVVTYRPRANLFSPTTLKQIASLRDRRASLTGVASVTTLLDVLCSKARQ